MTIGIEQFRTTGDLRLDRMLVQPFVEATGEYPFGGGAKAAPAKDEEDSST